VVAFRHGPYYSSGAGDPTESRLAMLEELPPETSIAVGNSAEAFVRAAPDATVIFNWSLGRLAA